MFSLGNNQPCVIFEGNPGGLISLRNIHAVHSESGTEAVGWGTGTALHSFPTSCMYNIVRVNTAVGVILLFKS